MNELSLFSGAGGGLLASKYMLGWKTIGYVEWEDYPQRVLAQRIKDGLLDEAPIFGDIRTFISEGYAERYRGLVDVVSGGFPCQPFSVAGKQKSGSDERNMWPATCRVVDIVRPSYVFLENVPGLISCGYIGNILKDLSEIGYDAKWQTLSSKETGAAHKRERLWVVANSLQGGLQTDEKNAYGPKRVESIYRQGAPFNVDGNLPVKWKDIETNCPDIRRGDTIPKFMDRIKCVGNGQDPIVAATAWNILTNN